MLDKIRNGSVNKNNVLIESSFKDKYPSFKIFVRDVELKDPPKDYIHREYYKTIVINEGEFVGIIHNGLSNLIKPPNVYRIWFRAIHGSETLDVVLVDIDE